MMKEFGIAVMLVLSSLFGAVAAYSQTVQGDIVRTIKDTQGMVVPNATVRIVNESTGAIRELIP
jgi:hypothetical protein